MMFEPKKLHPISVIYELAGNLKELIIPIIFIFFVGGGNKGHSFWSKIPFFVFSLLVLLVIVSNIIKWLRFTYWIEDEELRIEQGLFVKKKRYIPFERIQSVDLSESIVHRPFGLVKVKVETAGSGSGQAEAELSAIRKEEADALQQIIADVKSKKSVEGTDKAAETSHAQENILYKITNGQLLFLASTSGRAGVVISAFLAFIFQFDELIPFERLFNELQDLVRIGVMFVSIIVLIIVVIAWFLSVIIAFFKYNDFTVKVVSDDLVITRGLLEKRTTTVPLHRIQGLKITESPIRQPFGYASVTLENAGGSALEQDSSSILLLPVVKKKEIAAILSGTLPDYTFETPFNRAPKRALRRYFFIKLLLALAITGAAAWALWPYGLLAGLLVGLAMVWGYAQFKSAGWHVTDEQLTMRYRGIEQHTMLMKKNRIQSLEATVSWFQKRAHLAGINASVKSGPTFQLADIPHLDQQDVLEIFSWYSHADQEKVSENKSV